MSLGSITFDDIRRGSPLPECENCEDNNVKIELDRMPVRLIYHPEDLDNNPRADCAIFFPSEYETQDPLYRHETPDIPDEPDYLSIIELKSTYGQSSSVKDQLEGAIDFVIEVLSECDEPPWNLECYCLVPHDSGYKRRSYARITRQIGGRHRIFNAEPVNNGESLRDIVDRNDIWVETI